MGWEIPTGNGILWAMNFAFEVASWFLYLTKVPIQVVPGLLIICRFVNDGILFPSILLAGILLAGILGTN